MNETAHHPQPGLRIILPFLLVACIWGSTWYVITGQIAGLSPHWAVTYRFVLATPAMVVLALIMRHRLAMPRRAHGLALAIGLLQFSGNFTFVYLAERHLTSGIVALMIGMMLVPNAILGRLMLSQKITSRFVLGSGIALTGIALLLVNEAQLAPLNGNVALGTFLALLAMICASLANVIQAGPTGRHVPLVSLLGWAMFYGTLMDAALAYMLAGPPVFPSQARFWLGTAWLALAGSVVTFPIYFSLVRQLGAGRAAYNGVLVVVIAMAISTVLEGYRWTSLAIAGAFLALVGLLIALRARQVKAG